MGRDGAKAPFATNLHEFKALNLALLAPTSGKRGEGFVEEPGKGALALLGEVLPAACEGFADVGAGDWGAGGKNEGFDAGSHGFDSGLGFRFGEDLFGGFGDVFEGGACFSFGLELGGLGGVVHLQARQDSLF